MKKVFAFYGFDLENAPKSVLNERYEKGFTILALDIPAIEIVTQSGVPYTIIDDWLDDDDFEKALADAKYCENNWFSDAKEEFTIEGICWPEFDHSNFEFFWKEVFLSIALVNAILQRDVELFSFIGFDQPKPIVAYITPQTISKEVFKDLLKNKLKLQEKYDHLFKPYYKHKYVNELSLSFDEKIFNVDKNAVLTGYWQSEKYFKDIEDVIRKDFTFKTSLSEQNKKFIEMIRTTNSVAIHIRRGDYVSNPMALKIHGICSLEYYYKAMQFIEEKIDNPHYYVFSDDPEWAAQNLKSLYSLTYITGNNVTTYEDLRLMSNCKNHIIANSSFSWWGAWLQKNDDQIVIAPKPWYDDPTLKDYSTIYPDKWIKISKHE